MLKEKFFWNHFILPVNLRKWAVINAETIRKKNVFLITDKCTLSSWSGLTMMAEWVCFSLPGRCFGHVQPDRGEAGEIMCLGWLGIPPVELVEASGLPSWSCYPRELVPDRRLEEGQMEVSSFFCVFTLSLVLLLVCVLTKPLQASSDVPKWRTN